MRSGSNLSHGARALCARAAARAAERGAQVGKYTLFTATSVYALVNSH